MLSRKGYSLKKIDLSNLQIEKIKKDLNVQPVIKSDYGAPVKKYKIYRETSHKLYLPRYYAIKHFGLPKKDKLDINLKNMNMTFTGELRDYQKKAYDICLKKIQTHKGGILSVSCGWGKCLAKNTKVLMYNGQINKVQNIKKGDLIMGDDSKPRTILNTGNGIEMMYNIICSTNDNYIVNESHILSLYHKNNVIDISVIDYLKLKNKKEYFGYKVPIIFEPKYAPDPYLIGYTHKYIPDDYKINSSSVRHKVLNGFIQSNRVPNKRLKDDIIFIIRSIGLNYIEVDNKIQVILYEHHPIQVQKLQIDTYYGFEIDGNRRFVLGNFSVTHNTVFAIKLATKLNIKTLIIVHKEFLLNQWKERIQQFTNSEIGTIQGKTIDIEGKDFVIGMLQSLSKKDYPKDTFKQFGFLIVDECHCIATEGFSKALSKVIIPYNLGLSATPERKDGLSKVFKWNLGDIIYQHIIEREAKVQIYFYQNTEVTKKYDYRGKLKISTLLSDLSKANKRNVFILHLLTNLVKLNRKILILSQSRAHLENIKQQIEELKLATAGLYMGGMKTHQLELSKTKDILLATYSMASEAFDHKVLSILVMITPRVTIEQSIGRVLRDKNITPLIIDISDQVLIHQSQVRKKFYRSRNYTIEEFNVIDNEISEKNTRKYIRKSNIPKILNEVNNSRLDSDSD